MRGFLGEHEICVVHKGVRVYFAKKNLPKFIRLGIDIEEDENFPIKAVAHASSYTKTHMPTKKLSNKDTDAVVEILGKYYSKVPLAQIAEKITNLFQT